MTTNNSTSPRVLEPCPFCGVDLVEARGLANRTQRAFCHPLAEETCIAESTVIWVPGGQMAKWNTRHPVKAASPEEEGDRFWLTLRDPGRLPERKGPWPASQTASILREFIAARPTAYIDVLTWSPGYGPLIQHGPEVLQMRDGRSMSVGRKHNARTREAHAAPSVVALPSRDVIAAVINAWDDTLNPGGLAYEDIEARLRKDPRIATPPTSERAEVAS